MNKHALISIITSCCLCMSVSPISPKNTHTLSHPDQTITNHQIKFACKWIIRSWDIVDSVIFWLYKPCDIDLEDSNPFFPPTLQLMMMYHHIKSGYKWYCGSEHVVWKFECSRWPWLWTQQSNISTGHFSFTYTFVMLSILQSQFIEKGFKKAENSEQNVVLLLFLIYTKSKF